MKKIVLYIDSMQRGGAQRVMSVLASHFVECGIETILVNDIVPVEGISEYTVSDQLKRIFLDEYITIKGKTLNRILRLRKIINEYKPDCVLSFLGPPNIRMLIATIGCKCKKAVSVRNDPSKEYGVGVRRLCAKAIFNLADKCIFQTKDAALYFSKRVRRRSRVIFNPVDNMFYKQKWRGKGDDLFMVGRLQPQKNHMLAIAAFGKIAYLFPQTRLVICGEGVLREKLEDEVQGLGLQDRVVFRGLVTDVASELINAKCFVMSSDYEGMPNALMEAMAIGVPSISTDCPCGGPHSLFSFDKKLAGILVPCRDKEKLIDAMKCVICDNDLRDSLHLLAKQRAEEFRTDTILKVWDDYLGLI